MKVVLVGSETGNSFMNELSTRSASSSQPPV